MKNQKLREMLNAVILALFIRGCTAGEDPFNQDTDRAARLANGLYLPAPDLSMGNSGLFFNAGYYNPMNGMGYQNAQAEQYAAWHSMAGSAFGVPYNMPGTSRDGIDGRYFPSTNPYMHGVGGSAYMPPDQQGRAAEQCEQIEQQQHLAHSGMDEPDFNDGHAIAGLSIEGDSEDMRSDLSDAHAQQGSRKRKAKSALKKAPRKTKRQKKREVCSDESDESGSDSIQDNEVSQTENENKKALLRDIKTLDFKLWNEKRLNNKRRRTFRRLRKKIHCYSYSIKSILQQVKGGFCQRNLRAYIDYFSENIAKHVSQNPLLYFIAIRSDAIDMRYRDLLGLRELLSNEKNKEYREKMEKIKGYYPGVVDDLIKYVEDNGPSRILKKNLSSDCRETLGDIYLRKYLEPKYFEEQENETMGQIDGKYAALAHAMRMLLILPEVCQDFSSITEAIVESTQTSEDPSTDSDNCAVLLEIMAFVRKHTKKEKDDVAYESLYNALEKTVGSLEKLTAVDLYEAVYKIIGSFYENALVIDEKNNYILRGKNMLTNQKYMECAIDVKLSPDGALIETDDAEYTPRENKWKVLPNIEKHYHVYYVDNKTLQVRMLCMPIYTDAKKQEHYLHTVDDIVNHIKELYGVKESSNVIHPLKVQRSLKNARSRRWSYIEKEERKKTVKELAEYEILFYHIEEETAEKSFTFAEFRPYYSHKRDSIGIPLFLTPLMQSSAEIGPFTRTGKHKELGSLELKDAEPAVYMYNPAYINNEYSDVHCYYSNLWISLDAEKEVSPECYILNYQALEQADTSDGGSKVVKVMWYTRMPESVDAYTHYILDSSFKEEENLEKFNTFIAAVESRDHNKDSDLQGFWMGSGSAVAKKPKSRKQVIFNWLDKGQEEKSADLRNRDKKKMGVKELEAAFKEAKEIYENAVVRCEELEKELKKEIEKDGSSKMQQKVNAARSKKSKRKKKQEILYTELQYKKLYRKPEPHAEFIVLRCVNRSKSNLGAHNEILDTLVSWYARQIYTKNE
ncbi:hypothetical protein NEMIN01_1857 [Nematocida minor]|uniref:uncharacterized protein n=1 Tax=Nematocida minor TaxID=1912983 RepID=UPI002220F9E9|nr:uncharacterized protein NEMIN01_1857 [Nematocida minor]KAI5192164.1 hypothetical protein NEMIN01_1857 [Nematocida minor]